MKRLLFGLLLILNVLNAPNTYADTVSVDSLVSADDVTIAWLNGFKNTVVDALNSFDGENITSATIPANAMADNANPEIRWGEAFTEFVYSGLLPPTSASLTSITTAGVAYITNDTTKKMTRVEKDATSKLYTASKDTYVDLSSTGTFTYSEAVNGGAEPATANNSIRLAKVVTDATSVTLVTDMRVLGVQLSTNEDFYINGFTVVTMDAEVVTMDSGVAYVGGTRIEKVTTTALNVGTATDYVTGVSERGTSKWMHVYIDDAGGVKLDDTQPNYHDTDGNTTGKKYYYKSGSDYWRRVGSIRLNATGSGNIDGYQSEGIGESLHVILDVPVNITTSTSAGAWSAAVSCAAVIPPTSNKGDFGLYVVKSVADCGLWVKRNGSPLVADPYTTFMETGLRTVGSISGEKLCLTDSSQQIQYFSDTNSSAIRLSLNGYFDDR